MTRATQTARRFLLLSSVLNLAMVAAQVVLYPTVLGMPGGPASILQPTVLLLLYVPLVTWLTCDFIPTRQAGLRVGTAVGLACGVLEIAHIAIESFADQGARAERISAGSSRSASCCFGVVPVSWPPDTAGSRAVDALLVAGVLP